MGIRRPTSTIGRPSSSSWPCELLLALMPEGVDGAQDDQVGCGGSRHGGRDLLRQPGRPAPLCDRGALVPAPDRIAQTQRHRRGRVGGRQVGGCRGEHQQPGGARRSERQEAGVVADLRHGPAGKLHGQPRMLGAADHVHRGHDPLPQPAPQCRHPVRGDAAAAGVSRSAASSRASSSGRSACAGPASSRSTPDSMAATAAPATSDWSTAAMSSASVTTTPRKPSSPRSRSPRMARDRRAGRDSDAIRLQAGVGRMGHHDQPRHPPPRPPGRAPAPGRATSRHRHPRRAAHDADRRASRRCPGSAWRWPPRPTACSPSTVAAPICPGQRDTESPNDRAPTAGLSGCVARSRSGAQETLQPIAASSRPMAAATRRARSTEPGRGQRQVARELGRGRPDAHQLAALLVDGHDGGRLAALQGCPLDGHPQLPQLGRGDHVERAVQGHPGGIPVPDRRPAPRRAASDP